MKTPHLFRGLLVGLGLTLAQPVLAEDTTVRFGVDAYTTGSQIWVAQAEGYFKDAHIKPEITTFATGVEAIDGLLIGRSDMSVGLDFPIVTRLQGGKMTVLAGIFHSTPGFHKLVVANDIKSAADLKGKKIGIATGTAEHLITLKYLQENGLSEKDVKIVGFTSLMEIVASLRSGRIDASFVWADGTEKSTSDGKHYVLTDDTAAKRSGSGYLAASTSFTKDHPEAVTAVLGAMKKASDFIAANPDKAADIIAKATRAPRDTVRNLLNYNKFGMALTDYEKTGFDEVADFMKQTKDVNISFDDSVSPDFLKQVDPSAVSYTK